MNQNDSPSMLKTLDMKGSHFDSYRRDLQDLNLPFTLSNWDNVTYIPEDVWNDLSSQIQSLQADSSQTLVSGLHNIEVYTPHTITVTPRDSNGNNIGAGLEVYIQLSNKCTYNSLFSACQLNSGADNVIDYNHTLMNDIGNGSYSHAFMATKQGQISVFIYTVRWGYIEAYLNGSSTHQIWNNLYWNIPGEQSTDQIGKYQTRLKSPTWGDVDFTVKYDDQYSANISGVPLI